MLRSVARFAATLSCAVGLGLLLGASAADAQTLTRGPYLQMASHESMMIVWRTDARADGVVHYGTDPANLDRMASQTGGAAEEHEVTLSGLAPLTRYFYRIESGGNVLADGPDYRFKTHPTPGAHAPFRVLAWGDSGNASPTQQLVADNMAALDHEADLALGLGDLVYPRGEAENYDPAFFVPYRDLVRRIVIWPVIGNHDVGTLDGRPFKDNFRTPANNSRNDETYYSFMYGDVLFIGLDSQHSLKLLSTADQRQWLEQQLQNSQARWKIAFFHHPPYSRGSHDDDWRIKTFLVPALERGGVDLVLTGHSHVYERSYLLSGGQIIDNHANTYDKINTPDAAIYIVTGAGGKKGGVSAYDRMAFSLGDTAGNTILDFSENAVHGYWLSEQGDVHDVFRLSKGADTTPPRVTAVNQVGPVTELRVTFDEPVNAPPATSFTIDGGVTVSSVALFDDQRTAVLTTSAHQPGATYTIDISGVNDVSSNPLAAVRWRYDAGRRGRALGPTPPPDAGVVDSGVPPDSGVPADSGVRADSGVAADTGVADSGVADSGVPADSGTDTVADAAPTAPADSGASDPTIADPPLNDEDPLQPPPTGLDAPAGEPDSCAAMGQRDGAGTGVLLLALGFAFALKRRRL